MPTHLNRIAADLAPSGTLRAAINLGNPILAQGSPDAPGGVTVDIAHEVAARLGVGVSFICFDAARKSFQALRSGQADLGFLAIEPARAEEVTFTAPYALIEGMFAVPADSPIASSGEIDREGVRVGVKEGSAYDLFLTRTLQHATPVRGREGTEVFLVERLEAAAGIRQPIAAFVAKTPGTRLLPEPFMQIRQAVASVRGHGTETERFLATTIEELKASDFIRDALDRSGQDDAAVAGPDQGAR